MAEQNVTQAVESICAMGCNTVNAVIETLDAGKTTKGLEGFNELELQSITIELKAIMAVYENR